jgi:hypothetical protein
VGTFPKSKCEAGLGYRLVLGPLFCECPHPRALPYTECSQEWNFPSSKSLIGFLHFLDGLEKSEEGEEEVFYVFINHVFCNYVFCKFFIVFYIFSHHTQWASAR